MRAALQKRVALKKPACKKTKWKRQRILIGDPRSFVREIHGFKLLVSWDTTKKRFFAHIQGQDGRALPRIHAVHYDENGVKSEIEFLFRNYLRKVLLDV